MLVASVAVANPEAASSIEGLCVKGNPSMKETDGRFVQTHMQQLGMANRTYVLVDRQTGVNYLLAGFLSSSGVNRTGMTVLVDPCGSPIVTPIEEAE